MLHKPLSRCSPNQFSCGDGSCIPLSAKCDGMTDCKDELDESACYLVEFPTNRHYQDALPPLSREKGKVVPIKVR